MVFTKEWLEDNLLTTKEASDYLKVSGPQVRNLIKTKRLPYIFVASGKFFILKEDLAAFIDDNPCVGRSKIKREVIKVKDLSSDERDELEKYLSSFISLFDAARIYPIGVHNIKYLVQNNELEQVFVKDRTGFFRESDISDICSVEKNSVYREGYADGYEDCAHKKPKKY